MAEDINNPGDVKSPDQSDASSSPSIERDESDNQPSWQEIAGLDPKQFDSPEKLAQTYKEARKGLSEQGEKIKELESWRQKSAPILQTIWGDENLFKEVEKRMNGKQEDPKKDNNKAPVMQADPALEELQSMKEIEIIGDFEERVGISRLDKEQQESVRAEVGKILNRWLDGRPSPNLSKLGDMLTDAWDVYKSRSDVKIPDIEETETVGGFGTPRSSQPRVARLSAESLSPLQRTVAEKMGLTAQEYAEQLKAIMSE